MKAFIPQGSFMSAGTTSINRVVLQVSKATGVRPDQIMGRARTKHVVRARFAAMAIARDYLGLSYPAIGRAFDRDHTSIINAMRKVDATATDADFDDMEEIARRAGLVENDT